MEGIPLHWSGHWYAEQERRLESLSKSKKKKEAIKERGRKKKGTKNKPSKKKGSKMNENIVLESRFFLPSFTGFDRVVFADAFSWNFTGFYCFFFVRS